MEQDWFLERIGKTIYRNNNYCCSHCNEVYLNGLTIADEQHAYYIYNQGNYESI